MSKLNIEKLRLSLAFALVVVLFIFAFPDWTSAQSGAQGRLRGRLIDPSGLPVPGAEIKLVSSPPDASPITVSAGDGSFGFNSVKPGRYTLSVERSGFETATREVVIAADREAVIEISLAVAAVSESVTIVADPGGLTAMKLDVPLRDTPITLNTITNETLYSQGQNDLPTALRNVSSVNSYVGYGVYEYYRVRGFGDAVQLLDGVRNEGNRMNTQLNSIESVEVLKGPASVLYGGGAIGGAINLVRKKPQSDPAYDFSIGGGSFGTKRSSFGATGPLLSDRLLYRFDLGFEDSDGWRDNAARRFNATPSVLWLATPRDQINFHLTFNRDRFATDAGIPVVDGQVPNIPMSRRFNTPQDYALSKDYNGRVFYTHLFSDNLELRNTISYRHFDDDYFNAETLSVNTRVNPNLVNRQFLYFNLHSRPVFNQAETNWRFRTGFQHQMIAGWEYQRFYSFRDRSAAASTPTTPINLYNPVETHVNRAFPISNIVRFANTFNAFYAQDQLDLTRRFKALLGLRVDIYRRWQQDNPVVGGIEQSAARITRETNAPTYRAGLVYQTTNWWTLYGSVATSFTPVNVVPINNINLKPEEGRQFEIGQRLDFFKRRFNLTMAGYEIERRNVAFSIGAVTNAMGIRGNLYDQAARQRSRGFEFDLVGQPIARLPQLQISTNYGYTAGQFLDYFSPTNNFLYTGKEPNFVPRHIGNLWLTYQWRNGLGASIGGRYLSSVFTANENDIRLGGYATWDAAMSYRRSHWELNVNVYNLLDKERYFTGGIYRTQLYPGKPLNVLASLRFRSK